MLAKWINNDKGVTRLMIITMLVACMAMAGLIGYSSSSSGGNSVPVYAGQGDGGALQLRSAVIARGTGTQVNQVTFTVAIPDGAEPVNFTMPPHNVVVISYADDQQQVDDLGWSFAEYGPGDGDNLLEPGEKFRIIVAIPASGAGDTFNIRVKTPDGKVLSIQRTIPDDLEPVMNLC